MANEKYSRNKHFILLRVSINFCGTRQKSKHKYIKTNILKQLTLFLLLSLQISSLSVFVFSTFSFFIFSNNCSKLNSISCDICWSFKSSHLELFCKITIQLFSTGILLGLWSRSPPCNFTENYFSCTTVNGCFQSFN